jgi:uncharacterized protein involved in exopolysaccharide biosynthesis
METAMSLSTPLGILRGRWREGILVFSLVLAAVAAAVWTLGEKATAQAAVVLNLKAAEAMATIQLPGGIVTTHIATQVDVMQSERVQLAAIQRTRLADDPAWQRRWRRTAPEGVAFGPWAAGVLARQLKVSPAAESSVLTVSFSDRDPRFAADFANAVVDAFLATTLSMRAERARQDQQYYHEQAAASRRALARAQDSYIAYQRQNGIVVTDEKVNLEVERLRDMNTRLEQLQAEAADKSIRSKRAANAPERTAEVLANPVVMTMTEELSRQQAAVSELSARMAHGHPAMQAAEARLRSLAERRDAAIDSVRGAMMGDTSVAQQQLAQLSTAIQKQQDAVMALQSRRAQARLLERDVDNAQRAYDDVMAKTNQAALRIADPQTEASVIQVAHPPAPQTLRRAGVAAGAGLLAATLLACLAMSLREWLDRRVRGAHDILAHLGQPLLLTLPHIALPGPAARPACAGPAGSANET